LIRKARKLVIPRGRGLLTAPSHKKPEGWRISPRDAGLQFRGKVEKIEDLTGCCRWR
jgi:hypothetical protein